MTVEDLINELKEHPGKLEVIVDLHSDYTLVSTVNEIEAYDSGGYITRPYHHKAGLLAKSYVYIG